MRPLRWWRQRQAPIVLDPIGWDAKAGRTHDLGSLPVRGGGVYVHYDTCWCRR